jgi:hypothetical protein
VFKPDDIDGKSLTIQVGRNALNGTVYPFSYTGCKIDQWEIGVKAGEIATLALTLAGQAESTAQTLVTPTYVSGSHPVKFNHGAFTLGGTPVKVTAATIHANNGLKTDRYFVGSQQASEPREEALREYTWTADVEFADMSLYTLYTAGTESALSLAFTVGTHSLTINGNARVDGSTPAVPGRQIITQSLTGKFVASGATDDTAISATILDSVATP